jgi:hypothetical protein
MVEIFWIARESANAELIRAIRGPLLDWIVAISAGPCIHSRVAWSSKLAT